MLKMEYRAVQLTKMGPRVEHHGDETVRAVDLTFSFTTDNSVLDGLAEGLRLAYYKADETQNQLPGTEMAKVLRFPEVKAVKWEELVKDVVFTVHSVVHDEPDLVFAESKVGKVRILPKEGGSVTILFDAQVYAQPLQMSRLYSLLDDGCKVSWREMSKEEIDAQGAKQQALFPAAEPPADGEGANDGQADSEAAEFAEGEGEDCTVRVNGQEVGSPQEAEAAANAAPATEHVRVEVPSKIAKAIRRNELKSAAAKTPAKKAPAKPAKAPAKKPAKKPAKERPSAGGAA